MEPIFKQEYTVAAIHTDCFGYLKPSVVLHFAQEAAGGHCLQLNVDWDTLAKKNMFWALIRTKVQITRLPREGETITVETWPMPTTRVAYPRAVVALDEQGEELFRSVSLWVLMDSQTREMILPGKSGVIVEGILRGTELDAPKALAPHDLSSTMERPVRFNDLDKNGHMNNTRYLDWVTDLLPSDFYRQRKVQQIVLCYNQEARENQLLQLAWQQEDGTLVVDAHRTGTDDHPGKNRVFSAMLVFE